MAPIGQIYGSSFPKLRKGSLITGPFEQVANFFAEPVDGVEFGKLLKYGSSQKYYLPMDGTETDETVFAGIAMVEVAANASQYPGVKTKYEQHEPGNVLKVGSIAVVFSADVSADVNNVVEGGKVYVGADGNVSDTVNVAANLLIPNLIFTGDVAVVDEVTLVGIQKLY